MPELPEVHTTVEGLKKVILGKTIKDVWSDYFVATAHGERQTIKNKKYFEDAVKIANEIITVMQPTSETCIKVCSEYVLSSVAAYLLGLGFRVQRVESTGELKQQVEKGYIRWCIEKGVPEEILKNKKRFWTFLEWVAEQPRFRESLVKTGWASWERKWREEIYKKPLNLQTK